MIGTPPEDISTGLKARAETVWVAAFNRWMPTGYVEGHDEAYLAAIERCIEDHEALRSQAHTRLDRLEFYTKLRTRAWDEVDCEWILVPKRRPNAHKTAKYKKVQREIAAIDAELSRLRAEKAKQATKLSGGKAQRRAEFRKVMLTPEWVKADMERTGRKAFQHELDGLCNDDERAQKRKPDEVQYNLEHQRGHVVTPPDSPARDLYAQMRAQAVQPLTRWERFKRWMGWW